MKWRSWCEVGWVETIFKEVWLRLSKAVLGGLGLFTTSMETSGSGWRITTLRAFCSHLADSYKLDMNEIASLVI